VRWVLGFWLEGDVGFGEGGVDFEVDEEAFVAFLGEPGAEVFEGDEVGGDVFAGDAAAFGDAGEAGGVEEVDGFGGHSGGGGGADEGDDVGGVVAGFFEEFAVGDFDGGLVGVLDFIADEAGGDFDDAFADGDAVLFDEDDFVLVGDGEDADAGIGVGSADEVPGADAVEGEPGGLIEECGRFHGVW